MDAAADDSDAKLYRASGELLLELQLKLPQLVWSQKDGRRQSRLRVIYAKTEELVAPLELFQEWPQLLDGHLAPFLQTLCDAFLSYVTSKAENYTKPLPYYTVPLPRAICRLLYVFCKVRGQKVVVRFFNNEPRYIEPMLNCLRRWRDLEPIVDHSVSTNVMIWEERYIMLLWLSHLMLAPFDLASISSSSIDLSSSKLASVLEGLPSIAQTLLQTAYDYLYVSGKEREAASIMIVRLVLRGDMQARHLLQRVIDHALTALKQADEDAVSAAASAYRYVGLLSLLCGIMAVGSDDDVAAYLNKIFRVCIRLATSSDPHETQVRNTAPVRKSLVKAVRLTVLHTLSLTARRSDSTAKYDLDTMLEETIQYLLDSVSDKDTPVRMIASKSLSMITLSLEPAMSAEVVQAVLASLDENILLEDSSGTTFAITETPVDAIKKYRKNASAVDPLQWHGLILTLGHLLFRRSPPPQQLPEIIAALIAGLEFEQRSNIGTSVGVGVRDAACFGVWSLARKYSTTELDRVDSSQLLPVLDKATNTLARKHSAIQILANQLVLSACLDPSGNIRRGSSAALQELIGRHPDITLHGISVVQVVDYHAVARRSRAMIEVSIQAGSLDAIYLNSLLVALQEWRGLKSADADSRRWAAKAISQLTGLLSFGDAITYCARLEVRARKLKTSNTGSNAGTRHGILLGLSAMIRKTWEMRHSAGKSNGLLSTVLNSTLSDLDMLTGMMSGRLTRDLELVFEATSALVAILAETCPITGKDILPKLLIILERCLIGSEKDAVVSESTKAFKVLFEQLDLSSQVMLLDRWLHTGHSKQAEYKCRGRIEAVGAIFWILPLNSADSWRSVALEYIENLITRGQWSIETNIHAMDSLKGVLLEIENIREGGDANAPDMKLESVREVILTGLNDYTIDQRGDIGSTLRLKALEAAMGFVRVANTSTVSIRSLIQTTARLASEKLDKLRLQAWLLLQSVWEHQSGFPPLKTNFTHLADVSSVGYYLQLLELLEVEWLRKWIIAGLVSSAAAGTEDIGRASRSALVTHMLGADVEARRLGLDSVIDCLIEHLEQTAADDREAIPAMELLAFVTEQQLPGADLTSSKIVRVMQRAHSPASGIQRVEAAIKIYSALCNTNQRRFALDKLTRLLLHRYPKVRGDAADSLHLHTLQEELVAGDWTLPVSELKPTVLRLRKELKVL